jgi:predicted nucleic acid-binding protein
VRLFVGTSALYALLQSPHSSHPNAVAFSLVDWVNFEVMRRNGCESAFAIDPDFQSQGFKTLPGRNG